MKYKGCKFKIIILSEMTDSYRLKKDTMEAISRSIHSAICSLVNVEDADVLSLSSEEATVPFLGDLGEDLKDPRLVST